MSAIFSNEGSKEILYVIDNIAREKDISIDSVISAMENGLKLASRRKYGHDLLIECKLDRKTGKLNIFNKLEIVKDKDSELPEFDSRKQITLSEAKEKYKKGKIGLNDANEIKVGSYVTVDLPNVDLNRVAIQIARNEIVKKIKEAERDKEYEEFIGRVGTIINGSIKKVGKKNIVVEVDGYEALLTVDAVIPGERFRTGDRIRAYIKNVIKEQKGAQIFLSRTDNMFLAELFRQEVPEIYDGIIEIKGIARDPGSKAKVAVFSRNETTDIIGACIGYRGIRVQAVTSELKGEKIDVIRYSDNPIEYVISAISPAKPTKVIYNEDTNSASVVLSKDQLSLAIGRSGQNVRLASKITNIKIDVITEEEEKEMRVKEFNKLTQELMDSLDVEEVIAQLLVAEGYDIESIAEASIDKLTKIQGFNEDIASEIKDRAIDFIKENDVKKEEE